MVTSLLDSSTPAWRSSRAAVPDALENLEEVFRTLIHFATCLKFASSIIFYGFQRGFRLLATMRRRMAFLLSTPRCCFLGMIEPNETAHDYCTQPEQLAACTHTSQFLPGRRRRFRKKLFAALVKHLNKSCDCRFRWPLGNTGRFSGNDFGLLLGRLAVIFLQKNEHRNYHHCQK